MKPKVNKNLGLYSHIPIPAGWQAKKKQKEKHMKPKWLTSVNL